VTQSDPELNVGAPFGNPGKKRSVLYATGEHINLLLPPSIYSAGTLPFDYWGLKTQLVGFKKKLVSNSQIQRIFSFLFNNNRNNSFIEKIWP
jgi:hypothetical protein